MINFGAKFGQNYRFETFGEKVEWNRPWESFSGKYEPKEAKGIARNKL